jgi:hypothetical protein
MPGRGLGPPEREEPGPTPETGPNQKLVDATTNQPHPTARRGVLGCSTSQVSWWPVFEFWQAAVAQANAGPLPWPGTPLWCDLADGDPRKLLALAEFGVHHALRVETAQEASAEASRAVGGSVDWSKVSREILRRNDFYAARPWLRRAAS